MGLPLPSPPPPCSSNKEDGSIAKGRMDKFGTSVKPTLSFSSGIYPPGNLKPKRTEEKVVVDAHLAVEAVGGCRIGRVKAP